MLVLWRVQHENKYYLCDRKKPMSAFRPVFFSHNVHYISLYYIDTIIIYRARAAEWTTRSMMKFLRIYYNIIQKRTCEYVLNTLSYYNIQTMGRYTYYTRARRTGVFVDSVVVYTAMVLGI